MARDDRTMIPGQAPYKARCFTCRVGPWWASHNAFDRHGREERHPAHTPVKERDGRVLLGATRLP